MGIPASQSLTDTRFFTLYYKRKSVSTSKKAKKFYIQNLIIMPHLIVTFLAQLSPFFCCECQSPY